MTQAKRGISRRFLLTSAGASAVPIRRSAASNDPALKLSKLRDGSVLAVVSDLGPWEIPTKAFPGGTLSIAGDDVAIAFSLPAGLPIVLTFRFELNPSGQWRVVALWSGWPGARLRSAPVTFAKLVNPQPTEPTFDVALSSARLASMCGAVAGRVLRLPAAGRLRLDQRFMLSVQATKGLFAVMDGQVAFRSLALSPAAPEMPDWRAGAADAIGPARITLGSCKGVPLTLHALPGSRLGITAAEQPVRLAGNLSLQLGGAVGNGPIHARSAQFGKAGPDLHCSITFPDKPWRMQTQHGSCDVCGLPGGVGTVRSHDGTVQDADLPLQLLHFAVSAQDADVTRLDFKDANCCVTLPGTKQDGPGTGMRLPLGATEQLALPIDQATLYLARARDLFNLKMRFSGAELRLGQAGPTIHPRRLTGTSTQQSTAIAQRPPEPNPQSILVAEFPPQHILAQAYLRQTLALPDLDPPVTAMDRRVLERGGKAATDRRDAIWANKISSNSNEPEQVEAFKAFAAAWKDKSPTEVDPSERPWIGPGGLIGVSARQAARALVRELRRQKLDVLVAKLGSGGTDLESQGRVEEAIVLLAIPEPYLDPAEIVILQDRLADPAALTEELLRTAARDDRDLADLLRQWDAYRGANPTLPRGFVLATWPKALAGVRAKGGADLPRVRDRDAEMFLKQLALERSDQLERPDGPERYMPPPVVRLSGRSRLVFHLDRTLKFTIADLTAWHQMRLRVSRRAQRSYRVPGRQLDPATPDALPQGDIASDPAVILRDQQVPDARAGTTSDRIRVIARLMAAPDQNESAIELPARLFLSPAQDAMWLTPFVPGPKLQRWVRDDAPALMWTAELVERNADLKFDDPLRSTVRAVWSDDFGQSKTLGTKVSPGQVQGFAPPEWGPWDPLDPAKRLRFPLDRLDRHDLVFLSSVFGLPAVALRGSVGTQRSSQFRMPKGWEWSGLQKDVDDPALYMPRPLKVRRLALTARGGWLDHDTTFRTPVSPRLDDGTSLYPTSTLLRVRNLVVHGHDVETTVVRSGYLYPLGISASLVRETTLRIVAADPMAQQPGYVAVQVQRVFIQVSEPDQDYPAQGQPHMAREAPFSHVKIVTTRSPDLIDPSEEHSRATGTSDDNLTTTARGNVQGNIAARGAPSSVPLAGHVFWPRTELGAGGTVRFLMHVNRSADVVSMKLLFVDADAANSPDTLRALRERYYHPNKLRNDRLAPADANRIQHRGAPRAYAPEGQTGDTTFHTNWQDIVATGRTEYAEPDRFDAAQQGAEQPPFYPKLLRAEITSQQVDTLTGRVGAPILVHFHREYLLRGFDPAKPGLQGEWFLDTENPAQLDMGDNGDRGGGLGRQDHLIIGFSRKGPVGGPAAVPRDDRQGALDRVRYAQRTDVATDAAAAGGAQNLDDFADHFFGDDAKLLGIIPYKDLIKLVTAGRREAALPQLQETLGFKLNDLAAKETADGALEAAKSFQKTLQNDVANIKAKAEAATKDVVGSGISAAVVFPQLFSALDEIRNALGTEITRLAMVADVLARIWSGGQRVIAALNEIARSPLGPVAGEVRRHLLSFVGDLASKLGDNAFQPGRALRDAVLGWLTEVSTSSHWSSLVLLVPEAVRRRVNDTVTPDVWTAADPVAEIVRRAGPPLLTAEVLRGPLYDALKPVIVKAARVVRPGLQNGAAAIAELLTEVRMQAQRIDKLAGQTDAKCAEAAAVALDALGQLAPNIGICSTLLPLSLPGRNACSALDRLRGATETLVIDLSDAVQNQPVSIVLAASPVIRAAEQWRDAVVTAYADIAGVLDTYDRARRDGLDALGSVTTCQLAPMANLGAVVQRLEATRAALTRFVLPPQLNGALSIAPDGRLVALPAGLPPAFGTAIDKTEGEFRAAVAALVELPERISTASSTPATIQRLRDSIRNLAPEDEAQLTEAAQTVAAAITAANARRRELNGYVQHTAEGLAASAQQAEQFGKDLRTAVDARLRDAELRLLGLALRVVLATAGPATSVLRTADSSVRTVIESLYKELLIARNAALTNAARFDQAALSVLGPPPPQFGCASGPDGPRWSRAALLLTGDDGACGETSDALAKEASKPPLEVIQLWARGAAAPQRIANQLDSVAQSAMQSAVLRVLDVDALRRDFEDSLRKLIPLSKTMRNTVQIDFESSEVKAPGGIATLTFIDGDKEEPKRALTLKSVITTQLGPVIQGQTPPVQGEFRGRLTPFTLDIFKVVSITFKNGITYEGGTGRSGALTAEVSKVEFGGPLKFIAELAKHLTSGVGSGADGGNGPYCRVRLDRPAIEAGFRLNIAMIPTGVVFTNIQLLISALLPLNKDSARFRLALSSIDSPFRCSVPPWGGTGFFGMEASAKRIELIEASFEFGGVADIRYGPLVGTAYITTGVYVRKDGDKPAPAFRALFSAGFAAQVACFGVSGSFVIRMGRARPDDDQITGEARLRFSFSVGFATVSYEATATRTMKDNFGGAGARTTGFNLLSPGRIQLAALGTDPLVLPPVRCVEPIEQLAEIVTQSLTAADHWGRHATYFDQTLLPA